MWKPGQLITYKHKVYRVRKFIYSERYTCPCHLCSLVRIDDCISLRAKFGTMMPRNCYLKEIQCRDKSVQK